MPRSSSKCKSLPPLPIVAAHAGTSSAAALPSSDDAANASSPESASASASASAAHTGTGRRGRSCVTNGCIRTTVTLLVFGAYLVWTWPWHREHGLPWVGLGGWSSEARQAEVDVGGILKLHAPPKLGVLEEIQTRRGQYAPYRALGRYVGAPEGCDVTQVNILQRHGARYPNFKEGEQYAVAVERLGSVKKSKDKHLKHYEYDLGAYDLTPFGAAQTFESGQLAFDRYGHLVDEDNIPFVRAAGARRVVDSAGNWSAGFAAASRQRYQPYVNVVLPEHANNTLKQDCPNAADGSAQMDEWLSVFVPRLIKRLNTAAPGAELDARMVFGLMAMCPFESAAKAKEDGGGVSPFCTLFDEEDFRDFEYHGDVETYYKTGYGNALGAVQGVGYVNELLARLTGRPVRDRTTHDAAREFPLGRALYADFTHEDLMVSVFAAIGLFNVSRPLDPRVRPGHPRHPHSPVDVDVDPEGPSDKGTQRWIASEMVPFSARMVTERLACVRDGEVAEFVRILVNDAVQPLEFCRGGEERMCRLEDFVESQGYARRSGDGDFERCYN